MPRRHPRKVAPLTNGRSHVADCWARKILNALNNYAHDSGGVTPPNWIMRPRKSALDQRSTTRSPEKRIIVIPGSWRYHVEADLTLRESKRRRPTIPYYAQCQVRADVRAA